MAKWNSKTAEQFSKLGITGTTDQWSFAALKAEVPSLENLVVLTSVAALSAQHVF